MSPKPNHFTVLLLLVVLLIVSVSLTASAGSALDYGQLPGTPASANYIAWISSATPPTQVLTEDGYNSSSGTDQGYQGGYWLLSSSNFDNPTPTSGQTLNFVFGGLGADSGKIWTYSATLDMDNALTNHGTVGTQASGTCPTMLYGSRDATGKTINWSGLAGTYLIYRSKLASGAANQNSNGRYDYVATVTGAFTYKDTQCSTGTDCWHIVIPATAGGVPNGCHSGQETNPNAVTLSTFRAANPAVNWPLIAAALLLVAALAGFGVYRRRLSHVRAR